MKKVQQERFEHGGLGGKVTKYVRVIEVDDKDNVVGKVVDKKTPVSDWTEVTD